MILHSDTSDTRSDTRVILEPHFPESSSSSKYFIVIVTKTTRQTRQYQTAKKLKMLCTLTATANHTLTFTTGSAVVTVVSEPFWTGTGVTARCVSAGAVWATIRKTVNTLIHICSKIHTYTHTSKDYDNVQ